MVRVLPNPDRFRPPSYPSKETRRVPLVYEGFNRFGRRKRVESPVEKVLQVCVVGPVLLPEGVGDTEPAAGEIVQNT